MSKKLYEENSVQNIANAIRQKNGEQNAKYKISDMAGAILGLPSGGGNLISAIGTENGVYYPTNELLGKWQFNSSITLNEAIYCNLNFTSNGESFSKLKCYSDSSGIWLYYDDTLAYLSVVGWNSQNYKTIQINGGDLNNSKLLSFITSNAQKIQSISADGFSQFSIESPILTRVLKMYHGTITPSSNISSTKGIKIKHSLGEVPNIVIYRAKDNVPTQTYSMLAGIYIKDFNFIGTNYCVVWQTANANSSDGSNAGAPTSESNVVSDLTESTMKIKGNSSSRYFRSGTTYEVFAMVVNFDQPTVFNITYNLNGITGDSSNPTEIKPGQSKSFVFDAQEGYKVPEQITVENATYSYTKMSDTVSVLSISNPTNDVIITVTGVPV